ncbi:MAG: hypothetical protein ACP5O7_06275 [Phycisphaerae bacterium]
MGLPIKRASGHNGPSAEWLATGCELATTGKPVAKLGCRSRGPLAALRYLKRWQGRV